MLQYLFITLALLHVCFAPPVTQQKKEEESKEGSPDVLEDYIEYHRYIREVVNALESDPAFRDKLEKANEEDIRTGKIANELELVSHNVRTRLDEIKRSELQRLRDLMQKKQQLMDNNNIDDPTHHLKQQHHIDHVNPHTFEIEDLKKLITKTTEDLAVADKKRRDDFKEYEMKKEYEKFDKLNHTTGDEREKLEKEFKEMEEKHKKHDKLHTPGHKQQLEEVWEEQDNMQQEFNPKTFFVLHDLDSNGYWDQEEVKALFIKELDKMYAAGAPEDDMRERVEEMERMRESVFQEMDFNRDGVIDFNEFLEQTKRSDFNKDPGWEGIDEKRPYTDEELNEYMQHVQYQQNHPNDINAHMYPPGGPGNYPPGAYPGPQGGYPHGQPQMHQQDQMYPPSGQLYPQGNYPHGQGPPHGQGSHQMHPQSGEQYHPQSGEQYHPQSREQFHPQGGQFHPGKIPQAQVNPQQINNQMPPAGINANQHRNPNLNTNEIYSGGKQGNQQQYQPNQQQFHQNQQQFQQNQQQYQKQNQLNNPTQDQKQHFQQKIAQFQQQQNPNSKEQKPHSQQNNPQLAQQNPISQEQKDVPNKQAIPVNVNSQIQDPPQVNIV